MSQNANPDQNANAPPPGGMSPALWGAVAVIVVFLISMAVYTHWPQPPRTPAVTSTSSHGTSLSV